MYVFAQGDSTRIKHGDALSARFRQYHRGMERAAYVFHMRERPAVPSAPLSEMEDERRVFFRYTTVRGVMDVSPRSMTLQDFSE